jgi:hypothetical protein
MLHEMNFSVSSQKSSHTLLSKFSFFGVGVREVGLWDHCGVFEGTNISNDWPVIQYAMNMNSIDQCVLYGTHTCEVTVMLISLYTHYRIRNGNSYAKFVTNFSYYYNTNHQHSSCAIFCFRFLFKNGTQSTTGAMDVKFTA